MHDYSIKLLAVVEGPRELGDDDDDDDDSPHYCQANDRIRCMTELTAEGDKSAEKKKTKRGRDISDDLFLKK